RPEGDPNRDAYIRGSHLSANILHGLPVFKCGFHGQKIRMLAIVGVPLDRSACSRKAATARQPNCILRENLRQGVRELLANCRKIGTIHGRSRGCPACYQRFRCVSVAAYFGAQPCWASIRPTGTGPRPEAPMLALISTACPALGDGKGI